MADEFDKIVANAGFQLPTSPTAGQVLTAADTAGNAAWATATAAAPPVVTSLPTTGLVDGMERYLKLDTAGTYGGPFLWHCKYDASLSANKWFVLDGAPLRNAVATGQATSSSTYVALTTALSIPAPVAGIFSFSYGAAIEGSLTAGWRGRASLTSTDSESVIASGTGASGSPSSGASCSGVVTRTLAASASTAMTHRSDASNSVSFFNRWMEMRPVRIGG